MRSMLGIAAAFVAGALGATLVAHALEITMRPEPTPAMTDAQLQARVLSSLGQLVSHPLAIDVDVYDGIVRLAGPVLAEEIDRCLAQIASMDGVRKVHNALRVASGPEAFTAPTTAQGRTVTDELALAGWTPGI